MIGYLYRPKEGGIFDYAAYNSSIENEQQPRLLSPDILPLTLLCLQPTAAAVVIQGEVLVLCSRRPTA